MFTGLIEEVGDVVSVTPRGKSVEIIIACRDIMEGMRIGDSISVDGCCLTAERVLPNGFSAFASPETMEKTSLGERRSGDPLNLERALRLGDRLGGHMVSGHVDATGRFLSARPIDGAWELRISAPREITSRTVAKGSIAIDGISLTVVDLLDNEVSAMIIPETWKRTSLSRRVAGQKVNLESDVIGKYVFRYFETSNSSSTHQDREKEINRLLSGWGGN